MTLFTLADSPVKKYIYQEAGQPAVASSYAFEEVRGPELDPPNLPTRIIDVLGNCGPGKVRLRITHGERAHYAALSYCWGNKKQVLTTRSTLETFKNGIEVDTLPKTLQDAILTTQQLQIPYLWVDSLCNIQDDREDMVMEISMMPQVYKNATVTISAAIAQDCNEGFLKDRQEVASVIQNSFSLPFRMPEEPESDLNEGIEGIVNLTLDSTCGFKVKDFSAEPINRRAWTLQEAWLSRRLLIYGSGPLYWQCLSTSKVLGSPPESVEFSSDFEARLSFFKDGDQATLEDNSSPGRSFRNRHDLMINWKHLVRLYTRRELSFANDKLPALSGVAAEFQRLSGDTYLSGLWKCNLPWGLVWYQSSFGRNLNCGIPVETRSPSWSWAAVDGPVDFDNQYQLWAEMEIIVHSAHITLLDEIAPFGQVTGGSLALSGPIRRMTSEEVNDRYMILIDQMGPCFADYIIPDGGTSSCVLRKSETPNTGFLDQVGVFHNNGDIDIRPFPHILSIPDQTLIPPASILKDVPEQETQQEKSDSYLWFLEIHRYDAPTGLVLLRNDDGTFKRVGYFKMGRRALSHDESKESRGLRSPGPRNWVWDEDFEEYTIAIE